MESQNHWILFSYKKYHYCEIAGQCFQTIFYLIHFPKKEALSICALALIATVGIVEFVGRCSGLNCSQRRRIAPVSRSPATTLGFTRGHRAPLHHHYSSAASHNPSFGLTTRAKLTFQLGHIANSTLKRTQHFERLTNLLTNNRPVLINNSIKVKDAQYLNNMIMVISNDKV